MAKVLIIDADATAAHALGQALGAQALDAAWVSSGSAGVRAAIDHAPQVVLLEWSLPDISGIDVIRQLRADIATRRIPVIFVSAKSDEAHRVHAFEQGASDYVVKPYSTRELVLRIRALLRRTAAPRPTSDEAFGLLRVDRDGHRVFVADREVMLTRLEYDLLMSLLGDAEKVVTRDTLLVTCWGDPSDVTARTVDTHMARMRAKLGDAAGYVQTVRGRGYRFSPRTGAA